jgi:hypothetical protein
MSALRVQLQITPESRIAFLVANNQSGLTTDQAFIWRAFQNANPWVELYPEDVPLAAEMARNAELLYIAESLEEVGAEFVERMQ